MGRQVDRVDMWIMLKDLICHAAARNGHVRMWNDHVHGFKHCGCIHGCAERSLILNKKKASRLAQFCALPYLALNPTYKESKHSIRKMLHALLIVKKSGR